MSQANVLLKKAQIKKLLKKVPLWVPNAKETSLTRLFTFKNHIDALVFIARTTVHAQVQNHHPEIVYTFKKVKVILTTHDVKGLSKKDFDLALKIDTLSHGG